MRFLPCKAVDFCRRSTDSGGWTYYMSATTKELESRFRRFLLSARGKPVGDRQVVVRDAGIWDLVQMQKLGLSIEGGAHLPEGSGIKTQVEMIFSTHRRSLRRISIDIPP